MPCQQVNSKNASRMSRVSQCRGTCFRTFLPARSMKIPSMLGLVVMVVVAANLGATAAARLQSDETIAIRLSTARIAADSSLAGLAEGVLKDAMEGKRYSAATQSAAIAYLRDLRLTEYAPLLRSAASMKPSESAARRLADLIAITEALDTLRAWADPKAVPLNRARVWDHYWIQAAAVANLRKLGDWKSTASVLRVIKTLPLDARHQTNIVEALEFLVQSPVSDQSACEAIERIDEVYGDCNRPSELWRCGEIGVPLEQLRAKLSCPPTNR